MKIRSKERPELWYSFTDEAVTMRVGEDMRAWSWSQMDSMTKDMLPGVRKEIRRFAEGYRVLRKTPEAERNLDWRSQMAHIMGFTYGDLQLRLQLGNIVWEEAGAC